MTLYLKLGGRPGISRAVEGLLERLRKDRTGRADHELDVEQRTDLTEFLIFLSGGAPFYDGRPIASLLSHFCPNDAAFDRMVDLLAEAAIGQERSIRVEAELRLMMEHIRAHVIDRSDDLAACSSTSSAVA